MTYLRAAAAAGLVALLAAAAAALAGAPAVPRDEPAAGPVVSRPWEASRPWPQGDFLSTRVTRDAFPRELLAGPYGPRVALGIAGGRLRAATAGCPDLSAPVRPAGGRLRVGAVADAGCPGRSPEAAAQHAWLVAFLAGDPAYTYDGRTRTLAVGDRVDWLRFSPREVVQPEVAKPLGRFAARGHADDAGLRLVLHDDGTAGATGGCNWSGGSLRYAGGRLTFDAGHTTTMGCTGGSGERDRWWNDFLAAGPAYREEVDTLVLRAAQDEVVLRRDDGLPLAEGTRWAYEALFVRPAAGDPPHAGLNPSQRPLRGPNDGGLTFTGTGVRGSLGCARFAGPAVVGAADISFGRMTVDRSRCRPGARAPTVRQADWIVAFLRGERLFHVDDRWLMLVDPVTGRRMELTGTTPAERAAP